MPSWQMRQDLNLFKRFAVARMWMRVKRVAVWSFCAAAGRARKKIVIVDGIPELAMFFLL